MVTDPREAIMRSTLRAALAASVLSTFIAPFGCSSPEVSSASTAGLTSATSPLPRGFLPLRGSPRAVLSVAGRDPHPPLLTYRGGPLIQNGKVYTLFWGRDTQTPMRTALGRFYDTVGGSALFDWLGEYDVNGMAIHHAHHAGEIVDSDAITTGTVTNAQIQAELDRVFTSGAAPAPDNDSLYMIYFPPSVTIDADGQHKSCQSFCAYHHTFKRADGQLVYYGVIPDLDAPGCDTGCAVVEDTFSNLTDVSSHEWIEATTDPGVGLGILSWYNDNLGEIADICDQQETVTGKVAGFTVQKLWSNANYNCIVTPTAP
jgi:hypothetical protein